MLNIKPLELVFSEDGKAKSITTKISGAVSEVSLTVTNNHEKDASRYLLRDDSDQSNNMIMNLKSLTKDKMEASFDLVEDGTILDLKMDKVR